MIESSDDSLAENGNTLVDGLAGVVQESLQIREISETEASYTLFGTVNDKECSIRECCNTLSAEVWVKTTRMYEPAMHGITRLDGYKNGDVRKCAV